MEFVHIADMHLHAQFKMLSDKNGIGEQRRYDQRIILKKIINYIKNYDNNKVLVHKGYESFMIDYKDIILFF